MPLPVLAPPIMVLLAIQLTIPQALLAVHLHLAKALELLNTQRIQERKIIRRHPIALLQANTEEEIMELKDLPTMGQIRKIAISN